MAPSNLELAVGTKVTNLDFLSRAIFKHSFKNSEKNQAESDEADFFLSFSLFVSSKSKFKRALVYSLLAFSKLCLI